MCAIAEENIDNFVSFTSYKNKPYDKKWKLVLKMIVKDNMKFLEIETQRMNERENILNDVGQDSNTGPNAPRIVEQYALNC